MNEVLTDISELFLGNGIIIVLGCFVIGTILKGTIKNFPNNLIPYVNAVISVALGFLIPGTFEDKPIATKIILLAFLGLSSVGLYESLSIVFKNRFSLDVKKIFDFSDVVKPESNDVLKQISDEYNEIISGLEEESAESQEATEIIEETIEDDTK